MDNNEFINLYIEKLHSKLVEKDRNLILLETQFEYNQKAWEQNQKELEEKTKEIEKFPEILNKEIEKLNSEIHSRDEEIRRIKESYNRILEEKNQEILNLVKRKDEDLHPLTLQIEELKKKLVESQDSNKPAKKRINFVEKV